MSKEFPGQIQAGVVVGGHVDDPAPDMSGNMKIWSPTEHNPNNYPVENLPFSPTIEPATKSSQSEFGGVPDPSSMVATMKTTGGPPIILGRFRDFANPNQAVGGNGNAMMAGLNKYGSWTAPLGMNLTAQVKEVMEGGVPIRRRQQPQEYKASDMAGLPNHGALFPMSGFRWPQMQNIETATQHFNQVITSDMIGQLTGQISSLAGMLKGLNSGQKKQIQDSVPPEIFSALNSMVNQMPEISSGTSFMDSFRADSSEFANNATTLISQVSTLYDLQEVLHELDTNPAHRGLDKLANTTIEMTGPFGNTSLTITGTNDVIFNQTSDHQNAVSQLSSSMSSAGSSPGVNLGMNMFGPASETIADMIQRVAPETQAMVKSVLERVHTSQEQNKLTELIQTGGAKALTQSILSMLG